MRNVKWNAQMSFCWLELCLLQENGKGKFAGDADKFWWSWVRCVHTVGCSVRSVAANFAWQCIKNLDNWVVRRALFGKFCICWKWTCLKFKQPAALTDHWAPWLWLSQTIWTKTKLDLSICVLFRFARSCVVTIISARFKYWGAFQQIRQYFRCQLRALQ